MAESSTPKATVPPPPEATASSSAPAAGGPAPVIEEAPLEIDTQTTPLAIDNDADSTFAERMSAYTASLSSSVLNYPVEHGRTYHAFRAGAYVFPNDEREMDRLDWNHKLCMMVAGHQLHRAPLDEEKVHRILDIGTGTGIWAIEMGDMLPGAEVIGIDLSPIQSTWVPPNVKFEIDDVESPWVDNSQFDFIFSRSMAASIKDWPNLVQNCFDHLNPGGWAEFQDYNPDWYSDDGSMKDDSWSIKWMKDFVKACDKLGRTAKPGPSLEKWVRDAGFVNVVVHKIKTPVGGWPADPLKKQIGALNMSLTLDGLEAFTMKLFCDVLNWSEAEVHVLIAKVRNEMRTPGFHAVYDFYIVYGQKPEA